MAEEKLIIKVQLDDNGASQKLETLKSNVEALNTAASGHGITHLKDVANSLTALSQAASGLTNIAPAFKQVSQSAESLFSSFKSFKPGAYSRQISELTSALGTVSGALGKFVASGSGLSGMQSALNNLPNALTSFGNANISQQIQNTATTLKDLSDATEGAGKSGNRLNNLRMALAGLPAALKAFDDATTKSLTGGALGKGFIGNVGSVIKALSKTLDGAKLGSLGAIEKMANGLAKLNELSGVSGLSDNLKRIAHDIANFAHELVGAIPDDVLQKFIQLGIAIGNLGANSNKNFNTKNITDLTQKTTSASKAFTWLATAARKAAVMTGSVLAASVRTLASYFRQCVVYGAKLGKLPLQMLIFPIKGIAKHLNNARVAFGNFISRIGRIALYRAIRSGIKMVTTAFQEGVNNLYTWSAAVGNSFAPAMDSIATSFLYLKNSIGAAVSPLIQALAPAIELVTNEAVSLLNVVNQVFATLTGSSTWRKAVRVPTQWAENTEEAGNAADDTNDKVKALKRTLLGFDEINKLDDMSDNTGTTPKNNGGNNAGDAGALQFTEVQVSKSVLDLVDTLKQAWAKADFTEIGSTIADKIGTALLRVPWDEKIKPATVKVAKSLGTLLNGLFDYNGSKGGKKLWDGIAYTIYNGIDTAVLGYTTFFDTVHWDGIGAGVGAALRQVLEHINWTEGDNSVAAALAAFPNAVIDAFTGFNSQFTTDKFKELGDHIGETVSKALTLINWSGLFGNALKICNGLLTALNAALESFDWKGVRKAIKAGIKSIPASEWATLGKNIGNAIVNVTAFGANLLSTIGDFISTIKWKTIGNGIGSEIHDAIQKINWKKGTSDLGNAFASLPNAVIDAVTGILDNVTVKDFEDFGNGVGTTITKALYNIKWKELFNNAVGIGTRLLSALNGFLKGLNWSKIKDAIWSGIDSIPNTKWGELGSQIGQAIGNVAAFGANIADLVITSIKKIKWSKLMSGIWSGICTSIEENYGGWDGAAKALAGWIGRNLDIISIGLTFAIGAFTLKALTKTFVTSLLTKVGLLQVPGKGAALGAWVKALAFVGGIALSIDGIKTSLNANKVTDGIVRTDIGKSIKGVLELAVGGGLVGWAVGGFGKAVYGMTLGAGIALAIQGIDSIFKGSYTTVKDAFLGAVKNSLSLGLAGALIGFALGGGVPGAIAGAAIGITIATVLTLMISDIQTEVKKDAQKVLENHDYSDPYLNELFFDPYEGMGTSGNDSSSGDGPFGMTAYGADSKLPKVTIKAGVLVDQDQVEGQGKKVTGWLSTYFKKNKPITPVEGDKKNATSVATDTVTYITHYLDKHKPKAKVQSNKTDDEKVASEVSSHVSGYFGRKPASAKVAVSQSDANTAASNARTKISGWLGVSGREAAAKVKVNNAETAAKDGRDKITDWLTNTGTPAKARVEVSNANTAAQDGRDKITSWFSEVGAPAKAKIEVSNANTAARDGRDAITGWFKDTGEPAKAKVEINNANTAAREGRSAMNDWFQDDSDHYVKAGIAIKETGTDGTNGAVKAAKSAMSSWFTDSVDNYVKASIQFRESGWSGTNGAAKSAKASMEYYFANNSVKASAYIGDIESEAQTAKTTFELYFDRNPIKLSANLAVQNAANISKQYQQNGLFENANGGIYKNGAWHPVTEFAVGGYPAGSQMFIAREAGPELVGTIGGNTAVVNNNDIVSSVSAGVAQAVASVLGGGGQTNDVTIMVDSEVLYRAMKKGERRANGRYATSVVVG